MVIKWHKNYLIFILNSTVGNHERDIRIRCHWTPHPADYKLPTVLAGC